MQGLESTSSVGVCHWSLSCLQILGTPPHVYCLDDLWGDRRVSGPSRKHSTMMRKLVHGLLEVNIGYRPQLELLVAVHTTTQSRRVSSVQSSSMLPRSSRPRCRSQPPLRYFGISPAPVALPIANLHNRWGPSGIIPCTRSTGLLAFVWRACRACLDLSFTFIRTPEHGE